MHSHSFGLGSSGVAACEQAGEQQAFFTTENNPVENGGKVCGIVEKMSLGEVTDIVMQLLTIFWASAAGNLQLAYVKK